MAARDKAYFVTGIVVTGINFALIATNARGIESGRSTRGEARAGVISGLFGMCLGTAIMFSEETAVKYTGAGCVVGGAISFVYGIKAGRVVNRREEGGQSRGAGLEPVIVHDGRGRYGPGIQVSWNF